MKLSKLNSLNRIDHITLLFLFLFVSLSLSVSPYLFFPFVLFPFFFLSNVGSNLNPNPDNTRYGNGNNYNPGAYNPQPPPAGPGSTGIDPNSIFGNPNRLPQANQPWNNLPIFAPVNPTSGQASGQQQPIYPQLAQNYYPYNPINVPNGLNPHTDIFGHPPPGSVPQYVYPPKPTRTPGLLEQFLASGRRRNFGTSMHTATWQHHSFIIILSICNVFVGFILTARH